MKQRFVASIAPSPDTMRSYFESALGYVEDLIKGPSDPNFCLAQARKELRDALDYLRHFEAANEVLIFRGVRVQGSIGEKRVVGDLKVGDVVDKVRAAPAARGALEAGE